MTAVLNLSPEVLRELGIAAKVCVRPVTVSCTDTETDTTTTVCLRCGSTAERTCPACADRARRLRMQQCREGWHRDDEPVRLDDPDDVTGDEEFEGDEPPASPEGGDQDPKSGEGPAADAAAHEEAEHARRVRSTRRRQDVADLPRVPMSPSTLGQTFHAPDGTSYRPSMFLTLTLDSYGPVHPDGTPIDPAGYDYRRAALDALHFAKLEDRFWQNLRRCAGYKVQYFSAIEAQRRLAPHLHAAVRGVIPRQVVRQVVAATYHQLWWPPCDTPCGDAELPVWDSTAAAFADPGTGAVLPTWGQALDDIDADPGARPVHVLRFGRQFDYKGIIATDQAEVTRAVGYLTKYLAKDIGATFADPDDQVDPDLVGGLTAARAKHLDRLHAHVRALPCSPRCSNWLRYGVQPDGAGPHLQPGHCTRKAHDRYHLGLGGRRVHVSRQWTGKTLAEHATDRAEVVRQTLEAAGITDLHDRDRCSATTPGADGRPRYVWTRIAHHEQDGLTYRAALLRTIREAIAWREQYEHAKTIRDRAGPHPGNPDSNSATETAA